MKNFLNKLKTTLSIISGVAVIIYLYKLFSNGTKVADKFPKESEKKAAEKAVEELKDDVKELGDRKYSDAEIEEKFNK